tara:strand:+ start:2741 stop:3580 length:840 start_codon:yes stop_codon:yes gene_type:complete
MSSSSLRAALMTPTTSSSSFNLFNLRHQKDYYYSKRSARCFRSSSSRSRSVIKKTTKMLKVFSSSSDSSGDSSSRGEDGGEKKAEDIPPEDYAIVVELLDCETGDEIQEKADLMAKNGLITAGVVEAARVILDGNIQQGQDEEIILILRAIYDVLLKELQKIRAPYAKKVLEFAQEVMGMFTAEDLECNNEMALSKVRLVLQEEFDKDEEIGVTREALEKYLGDVLPVMDMQDDRLKEQLAACEDPKVQVQMVAQMMQRTKERMQIDHLREVARTFRSE